MVKWRTYSESQIKTIDVCYAMVPGCPFELVQDVRSLLDRYIIPVRVGCLSKIVNTHVSVESVPLSDAADVIKPTIAQPLVRSLTDPNTNLFALNNNNP
jgi:hypothetical protein